MALEQDVSWNDIETLVEQLCKKILKLPRTFSSITTLSRGGFVPSRLVADYLGIETIHVDKRKISSDSLFVDDIFDTGTAYEKSYQKLTNPQNLFLLHCLHDVEKNTLQTLYMQKKLIVTHTLFSLGIN